MIRVMQFADVVNRYDFIDVIVQHFDRGQFTISLCLRSLECKIAKPVYPNDVKVHLLPGSGRSHIPLAAWRLASLLRREQIDIVHCHHYDQAVIAWLATRLYPQTKLVIGRHYSRSVQEIPESWKRSLFLGVEHRVNRAADAIIVPTAFIHRLLHEEQHVPIEKLHIVPYAFFPEKYDRSSLTPREQVRKELNLEGKIVVASFGRLDWGKGQVHLVEALERIKDQIPNLVILIVGEGPERGNLEREIAARGLADRVQLPGWRRDVMAIMNAVDAVAQPTYFEAFSQVMAEAMFLAKPLIMTPVSGTEELIEDGVTGYLVPIRDSAILAERMRQLASDPELRERMGGAAEKKITQNNTVARIMPMYEAVYRKVME